jgi:hypothetical protein
MAASFSRFQSARKAQESRRGLPFPSIFQADFPIAYVSQTTDCIRAGRSRNEAHARRGAIGKPLKEVWPEIEQILSPLIDAPFKGGTLIGWLDD